MKRNKDFDKRKKEFLKKLEEAEKKGEVDKDIISLLHFINSLQDYFTTSSCSGRIILLKPGKTKKESEFLFKKHSRVEYYEIKEKILELSKMNISEVWLKVDPVILHVDCRDLESARKMLDIARESGWKRSGMIVIRPWRYLLELESTERLETIIIYNGKILPDEDYLKILVEKANNRLQRTKEKLRRFFQNLKKNFHELNV